jgi:hypothetical protein
MRVLDHPSRVQRQTLTDDRRAWNPVCPFLSDSSHPRPRTWFIKGSVHLSAIEGPAMLENRHRLVRTHQPQWHRLTARKGPPIAAGNREPTRPLGGSGPAPASAPLPEHRAQQHVLLSLRHPANSRRDLFLDHGRRASRQTVRTCPPIMCPEWRIEDGPL